MSTAAAVSSSPLGIDEIKGSVEPRLFPPPLRELTPATSYGFDVITFASEVLRTPLDPWQRWVVIHAGELLPDGRPRFKKVLLIVARQNGKSFLLLVLTLFWLFVEQWPLVVGQHSTLSKAKGVWIDAQKTARATPELAAEFGTLRLDNNDPHWMTAFGSKYMIEAANEKGGRGGSIDRFVVDELRLQQNWRAFNAIKPTLNARPYGQGWWITNMGDQRSVVLLSLRKTGEANIRAAELGMELDDPELCLLEYSAPTGSDMLDPVALAMANPNANHRVSMRSLLADARSAIESGDQEQISGFKTEIMCMYVPAMDPAVSPEGWKLGEKPGVLDTMRNRLALVPELSPDRLHASVSVAALLDTGQVRVEVLHSWAGPNAAKALRSALPGWVRKVRPRKVGWLPGGGAAALAAEMKFGPGIDVEEIRGEVNAVCMGFAEMVAAGDILHSGQELLTKQVTGSMKLWSGDTWRFSRKGEGHCDTAYGVAAAAHLARTMPPKPTMTGLILTPKGDGDRERGGS